MGYTKVCNHPQSSTTIHNHSKNHPQPSTTTYNYPQNHPQPPITIHNHPKVIQKNQNLSQTVICYCTLDANAETDAGFDSNMKQWYIYMCACVSVYKLYIL